MASRANYSGLLVAGAGFFLTRFTVTLAIYEDPVRFYLAGIVPLTLGLGLAAFGVALTVADVQRRFVRTVAAWCVVGAGTMLVLVVLTLLGSTPGGLPELSTVRSQAYLSNFLIGGSVGGTMTGLYAASNRRHRDGVRRQADRLTVLNRLLRHEVLNALTIIRGTVARGDGAAASVVEEKAAEIERTIEEVRHLARSGPAEGPTSSAIDLRSCLEASVEAVTERYPEATVAVDAPAGVSVRASPRLTQVFTHLLENAVVHARDAEPRVEVSATPTAARVRVVDDGPGLSEAQRRLLERGDVEPYDDPGTGFGLNLVRLYVDDVGGHIEVDSSEEGAAVTVEVPRSVDDDPTQLTLGRGDDIRPALPHLLVTLVASLLAGGFYGLTSGLLGGSVAGIGVFYGAASPVVGWITHEFHSVVFGFVFAGLLSVAPERHRGRLLGHVAVGLGWAIVLWLLAAGVVAPVWLQLLGIPAAIPNLSIPLLVNHLAWGLSLGVLTAVGYRHVAPRLGRWLDRLRALPDR